MSTNRLYVRLRGKILGPFDLQMLKQKRDRGQLGRFHEVSEDRVNWCLASTMPELFPPAEEKRSEPSAEQGDITHVPPLPSGAGRRSGTSFADSAEEWYYLDANGSKKGPLTRDQLLRLLDAGTIGSDTLVWNQSLAGWKLLASIPGLSKVSARRGNLPTRPSMGLFWVVLGCSGSFCFMLLICCASGLYLATNNGTEQDNKRSDLTDTISSPKGPTKEEAELSRRGSRTKAAWDEMTRARVTCLAELRSNPRNADHNYSISLRRINIDYVDNDLVGFLRGKIDCIEERDTLKQEYFAEVDRAGGNLGKLDDSIGDPDSTGGRILKNIIIEGIAQAALDDLKKRYWPRFDRIDAKIADINAKLDSLRDKLAQRYEGPFN